MKRYLLFSGYEYESSGGAGDLVGDFETPESAIREKAPVPDGQWAHVLDTKTGEVTDVPGVPLKPLKIELAGKVAAVDATQDPTRRDDQHGTIDVLIPSLRCGLGHEIPDTIVVRCNIKGKDEISRWWGVCVDGKFVKVTIEVAE